VPASLEGALPELGVVPEEGGRRGCGNPAEPLPAPEPDSDPLPETEPPAGAMLVPLCCVPLGDEPLAVPGAAETLPLDELDGAEDAELPVPEEPVTEGATVASLLLRG
jgi:hypothetical protein